MRTADSVGADHAREHWGGSDPLGHTDPALDRLRWLMAVGACWHWSCRCSAACQPAGWAAACGDQQDAAMAQRARPLLRLAGPETEVEISDDVAVVTRPRLDPDAWDGLLADGEALAAALGGSGG